jgi:hypothetical protein
VREQVDVTVSFEVFRKGTISFMYERIQNMVSWQELHQHHAETDKRIPPYACYIPEEDRPYYPNTILEFGLNDSVETRKWYPGKNFTSTMPRPTRESRLMLATFRKKI